MDIRAQFAHQLRRLRQKEGYGVTELAKRSGISRQHIRELELPETRKRVTIVTLNKIAQAFRIPIWKLLKFK